MLFLNKNNEKLNIEYEKKIEQLKELEDKIKLSKIKLKDIDFLILKLFRGFATKGNMVALSVAVVVGGTLTNLLNSLVKNVITPAIYYFNIVKAAQPSYFNYPAFQSDLISFLVISTILFIISGIVVKLSNRVVHNIDHFLDPYMSPEPPPTKKCPFCCTDIPVDAIKCPNCISDLKE